MHIYIHTYGFIYVYNCYDCEYTIIVQTACTIKTGIRLLDIKLQASVVSSEEWG